MAKKKIYDDTLLQLIRDGNSKGMMNSNSLSPSQRINKIQHQVLSWFELNGRDLPWRKSYSPYQVWISEIMLQQTQVRTVVPYFLRWMEKFPDPAAVAAAGERDIMLAWEGLGYYTRAKNIHRTAQVLVSNFGGRIPDDFNALIALPGIGRYTAGAIQSIAFNLDFPAVDANAARILRRLFNRSNSSGSATSETGLRKLAAEILPRGRARQFNQALMDLGATICLPELPRCDCCPLAEFCEGKKCGLSELESGSNRSRPATPIEVSIGVIIRDGRIFIQKRPDSGLMPYLWEFPGGKINEGESPKKAVVREIKEELGIGVRPLEKLALIRHCYTRFRVALHAYLCEVCDVLPGKEPVLRAAVECRWVPPAELALYPFPAANRRLIGILLDRFGEPC
ncbi:MAG: A/G-specific adenine glycosylase [Syntrophobacteraceae bacterium]